MDPKIIRHSAAPMAPITFDGETAIACDCEAFLGPGGPLPTTGVTHVRLQDLSPALLATLRPSLVILPLFAGGQDAMSAVERLEELGYIGRISVLAPSLPKPRLVERELRALGPGTRLVLISP